MSKQITFFRIAAGLACILIFVGSCSKSTEPGVPALANKVSLPDNMQVTAGEHFAVPVNFENNVPLAGISVPLKFSNDYVRCDSVSYIGSRVSAFLFKPSFVKKDSIKIGAIDATGVMPGSGLLATVYFWAFGNAPESDMVLDTTYLYPSFTLVFADTAIVPNLITPEFKAGKVHIKTQL